MIYLSNFESKIDLKANHLKKRKEEKYKIKDDERRWLYILIFGVFIIN